MNRLGLSALLTLLWAVLMLIGLKTFAPYPFESRFHQNVASPILAIELSDPPRSQLDVDQVLRGHPLPQFAKHNPEANHARAVTAIRVNALLDLVFIPLYVWYFIELARAVTRPGLARPLALIAILAGIFDYVEDGFIFAVLSGGLLPVILPSLIKWGLISLVLLGLAVSLLASSGRVYSLATERLTGLVHLYAGALVFLAVTCNHWYGYSWIETGNAMFAATVLINGIYPVTLWFWRKFPGRKIVYVEDFCERRSGGEQLGQAVRAE
jgi:hypothetical protein